jgi:hypothetical protein
VGKGARSEGERERSERKMAKIEENGKHRTPNIERRATGEKAEIEKVES